MGNFIIFKKSLLLLSSAFSAVCFSQNIKLVESDWKETSSCYNCMSCTERSSLVGNIMRFFITHISMKKSLKLIVATI